MKYWKTISLKNGAECLIRSVTGEDAMAVCESFRLTHAQTDYLLSYPEENSFTEEQEKDFLAKTESSDDAVELCAFVGSHLAATAGIEPVGKKFKVKHRADFGIGVEKDFWGLGIGRALIHCCIDCAIKAGYTQLELQVVSDNANAIALYKSVGFTEFGRNPKGFFSRSTGWQELILMRLELGQRG